MGLRSAANICQRVTNAISFIMLQVGIAILNYLDNFAGAEKRENANFAYLCLGLFNQVFTRFLISVNLSGVISMVIVIVLKMWF